MYLAHIILITSSFRTFIASAPIHIIHFVQELTSTVKCLGAAKALMQLVAWC